MLSDNKLEDLYNEIAPPEADQIKLIVAPPIRFAYKQSDYLYLLYKNLFKSEKYIVQTLSGWKHIKLIFSLFKNRVTILHYHWLECSGVLNLPLFLYKMLCLMIYKWSGGRLIWTIHNKMPPDGKLFRFNFYARRWMARNASLLHIQCRSVIPELSRFFEVPQDKFRLMNHPKYPHTLLPRAAAVEAINLRYDANLKIQDKLFLMIGHISPYKRIATVCKIFSELPVQKKLIIAGPVKRGQMKYFKKLKKLVRQSKNVILIPQFISEENVPEFMNACDYALFNFRTIFSSGGIHLAKSYKMQIILPDQPCMKEIEYEKLYFFDTKEELKKLLEDC